MATANSGLYYGQYFSQFDVRQIATGSQAKEYVIDGNVDVKTAVALRLNMTEWNANIYSTESFLVWVKQQVKKGYPTIICVYMNWYLFYLEKSGGDIDCDHIVSVIDIQSNFNDNLYHPTDMIYFSDFALWTDTQYNTDEDPPNPQLIFNYTFGNFQKTRTQANSMTGPIYSLATANSATKTRKI